MRSPETRAERCLAVASAHLDARELAAATHATDEAEQLGAHPNSCDSLRWMIAMFGGNFEHAWQASDAIRARGLPDPHRFWQGEDLRDARVVVRCLHGLGDALQMLRYAPRLAAVAKSVVYEVPPQLLELAPHFEGVSCAITWGEQAPPEPPRFDVQVEVMELPYLFRTQPAGLPVATKYLRLPRGLLSETAARMGSNSRPRAGIVWAAGEWNPERSLPLSCLQPLLEQTPFELWSLQGGTARTQLKSLPDATDLCGDGVLALAAAIAQLDLVITVDTLAAHLAGALGKPVCLLLGHAADWRWQVGRANSPWYPSLRIFRQPRPGDWPAVIAQVCQALAHGVPA